MPAVGSPLTLGETMNVREEEFFILAIGECEDFGFNSEASSALLKVAEATKPDGMSVSHSHIILFYLSNNRTEAEVSSYASSILTLKDKEAFSSIGIGTAKGTLSGEFDGSGRMVEADRFSGDSRVEAVQSIKPLSSSENVSFS